MAETDERGNTARAMSQASTVGEEAPRFGSTEDRSEVTGSLHTELKQVPGDRIAELVHDLRTPLVAIRGYTRMIVEERAGPINGTQREYLSIVAENTNRVIQLLNDLVQLTTNQPLHLESFDARDLWPEILRLAQSRASGKSIRIQERMPPEHVVIVGDRKKLTEAFSEILFSSVRFVDPHGEIVLELSPGQQEGVQQAGAMIRFIASGGEVPERIQEAFNRGARQNATSPETQKDPGLGLSLACDLIRLHRGRASVSSNPGEGFSFSVSLPALNRSENL